MGSTRATAAKKPAAAAKKSAAAKKTAPSKKKAAAAAPKKRAAPTKKKAAPAKKAAPKKAAAKKAAPVKTPAKAAAKAPKGKKGAAPVTGKRGLKGQAAPDASSGRVGTVDPAAGLGASAVLAEEEVGEELDAMLTLVDVKKNMDKYFILQVINEPAGSSGKKAKTTKGSSSASDKFYFFTRWGRTGTSGQGKLEGPFDTVEEGSALFCGKFEEKTGNEWEVDDHEDRYVVNKGKYKCLRPNASQVQAETWQYWVDDGVNGKTDGWYDYDDAGAMVVEHLHAEFQTNPSMHQRVVVSGDMGYRYLVDLSQMTQTNVDHPNRKMRHIRRNPGKSLPNTPPGAGVVKGKGKGKATVAVKAAPAAAAAASSTAEVDKSCPKAGNPGVSVCSGHDVKLNQTNIANNNNKFYILQMCRDAGRNNYFVWTRWGRVGEAGATMELGPFGDEAAAATAFAKKFRDKTGNKWQDAQGGEFTAVPGKYELIETDSSDTTAAAAMAASGGGASSSAGPVKVLPSKLDAATKELVELIFSEDMFKTAMSKMNVDVKRMPLGQLSNAQVQRGYAVLEELEDALKMSGGSRSALLQTLSSKFYQVIPHSFGRQVPPVINDDTMLREKVEMLNVLQDIGEAQTLLSSTDGAKKGKGKKGKAAAAAVPTVPHPTDVNYEALNADLSLLSPQSHEYKTIKTYMENTKPGYGSMELYNVWAVDREGEAQRFKAHDKVDNRKLLWHGTNVAVVAAIVKSGLRIMPHSGGRVGKGIYLASENAKSRQYVRPAYGAKGAGVNMGVMFLCEAALGKEASITVDDWKLTKPPQGYDSIVARGCQEPDPSKDVVIKLEGKTVSVPQGKPKPMAAYKGSRFGNSEYLVYKESQQRIRYMLTVKC